MDPSTPLILSVSTPEYGRVRIETSDGCSYEANLQALEQVYCFPRTADEWQRVGVDADGRALVWTTRFEVHADQVIGLADSVTKRRSA